MSWYETAFRREYLHLYRHRDEEAARREAEFAVRVLGLREGCRILDVACGAGRHARALSELGHRVVGLDLSRELLAEAAGTTRVRADMRALPFSAPFDAATSFFTSFGYFDEEGNEATLRAIRGAVRPRGVFLLDFLNATAVRVGLVPESTEEHEGKSVRIRRSIEEGRVLKEVLVIENEERRAYSESVRLYQPYELDRMLRGVGFEPVASYGDFDGRDYTTDAPRCILVARKP